MLWNKRALLNTEADWIVVSTSGTHIEHIIVVAC